MVKTEIVPEHRSESVIPQEIVPPDLSVAHVFFDIGIVVIFAAFRDAIPSFQKQGKPASFETYVPYDTVPAPRQRLGLAVGLVVHAHLDEASG